VPSEPLSLAEMLPAPQFRERHERLIEAPPAAVWSALHELRLVDLALSRALMDLRSLPARIARGKRPRMVTGRFLEEGPVPVLVSLVNHAVVAGGLLQPWKLFGGAAPPKLDAAGLQAFHEPGWVKVGLDFVLEPDGRTETRVVATDARNSAAVRGLLAPDPCRVRPDSARHPPRGRSARRGAEVPGVTRPSRALVRHQQTANRDAIVDPLPDGGGWACS